MKQQKCRTGVTEGRDGVREHNKKGWTDKYWFNKQCREERSE
jgi:hypothetical protein